MKILIKKFFSLTIGLFKKSNSASIQIPNYPPIFNFTPEQLQEAQDLFDRNEQLQDLFDSNEAEDLLFDRNEQYNEAEDLFDLDILNLDIENMLNNADNQYLSSKDSLNIEQLIQNTLDNEGDLDAVLKNILNKKDYEIYQAELQNPDFDFSDYLQDIFDNMQVPCINESTI